MASPDALRALLPRPEAAAATDAPGTVEAAVLVPLVLAAGELHGVFTRRRDDLRRHAGEISFPGGRREPRDEDLRATALREAEEEIGLSPGEVELVGALPPTRTFVTGYRIHPFVGAIAARRAWTPAPTEVAAVLELPLPALAAGYESRRLIRKGVPYRGPTYTIDGHLVWGATARIVQELLDHLKPVL